MSDHDMPDVPTADEAMALAVLDARGRQAGTNLRAVVGALVAARPAVGMAPPSRGQSGRDPAVEFPPVIGGTGPRRSRAWLVAAALAVLLGLVAALVLATRSDDQDAIVSDQHPAYLVPGRIPEGWQVQEARTLSATDSPGGGPDTIVVYGEASADDPWAGPKVSVWRISGDELGSESDGVEQIEVAGLPATISESDATTMVRIIDGDDMILVLTDQVERSVAEAVAEAVVTGDETAALPDGFTRLADGPAANAGTIGFGFALDGFRLLYGGPTSDEQMAVIQRAGDRDDAELVQLMGAVQRVEVRGQPAYLSGGSLLQWYEPSAQVVVTVYGNGEGDFGEIAMQFAEGLRPPQPGEVDELLRAYGVSGPFDRLEEGEVLVAEGKFANGDPWQLVAGDDGSGGVELTFSDPMGGTGIGVMDGDGWGTLTVDIAGHGEAQSSGEVGVYGAVTPQAAEVAIEVPGRPALRLDLHTVDGIDGWDEKVFVGLVPVDLPSGAVVVRDATGAELARELFSLQDSGEVFGGGATTDATTPGSEVSEAETCRDLPDGGVECSASSASGGTEPGG